MFIMIYGRLICYRVFKTFLSVQYLHAFLDQIICAAMVFATLAVNAQMEQQSIVLHAHVVMIVVAHVQIHVRVHYK